MQLPQLAMSAAPVVLLPVGEARQAIVRMIRQHNAVILVGETGSGKSTQVPQYVWDDILSLNQPVHSTPTPTREPRKDCASHTGGKDTNQNKNIHSIQNGGSSSPAVHHGNAYEGASIVGCTQPRRVAAVSIARHVAHLRGGSVGEEVGYAIRFDDTCTPRTRIKYMTDGILLREIQADKELRHYGCILLDEAHERTLHGDVLFGLLKDIARQRRHTLKIVVMSATLNAEQFSKFWWNAPIGVVHGRTYPVTIMHTVEPQVDYVEATVSTVLQIHHKEPAGDVLCFLTGQEEIEDAKRILEQRMRLMPHDVPDFSILTLYSAMPYEQQLRIFEPTETGRRKVILATNIAETSITVEGIKYVVDCGVVKAKYFNSKTGMEALTEVDVSRAQATQRAGRAGRMTAGKCFRLYPSSAFEALQETTTPEIRRSSLMSVVLQMKSLEIDRIMDFEFMDMPEARAVVKAEETLMLLRALDRHGRITPLGRRLTDFAVDPMAAMCLLAGKALRVAQDVCVVVAMTHTENIFLASRESKEGVDRCRAQFAKAAGDHATVLHMYRSYRRVPKAERRVWCETNSLNDRQMLKAEDVVTQLMATLASQSDDALMTQLLASLPSTATHRRDAESDGHADEQQAVCGHVAKRTRDEDADAGAGAGATEGEGVVAQLGQSLRRHQHMLDYELVRRALCFGYFLNAAFFNAKLGMYQTIVGQVPVHVHPSSVLFTHRRKPPLVIYNNIVRTTRRYMKDLSIVHEEWLQEAAHSFFRRLG